MRHWLAVAVLVAAVVALVAGAAAATPVTFQDSTGEDSLAPDITSVTVSNDNAGLITMRIAIPNRPALTADMLVNVFIGDRSTAAAAGEDLIVLQLDASGASRAFLWRWNGSDWDTHVPHASLGMSWAAGPTISINAVELGGATAFDFYVAAVSGLDPATGGWTNMHTDFAPDRGRWSYQVTVERFVLSVARFFTVPAQPKAGKPFLATLVVADADTMTGTPQVSCRATIGGKALPVKSKVFAQGAATCGWQVPGTGKGTLMKGSVTVALEGVQVSRSFSLKVR